MKNFIKLICLLVLFSNLSFSQTCRWATNFGGKSEVYEVNTRLTSNDETIVAGNFFPGNVSFNNGVFLNDSLFTSFLARYSSSGLCKNAIKISDSLEIDNICIDSKNDIYISGKFTKNKINFTNDISIENIGVSNFFIAKFDVNFNIIYAKAFGTVSEAQKINLSIDKNGAAYVCGYCTGPKLVLNSGKSIEFTTSTFGFNSFIAKFDDLGNCVWIDQVTNKVKIEPENMVIDNDLNVYLSGTGITDGPFGPYKRGDTLTFNNSIYLDGLFGQFTFLAKYNPAGRTVWARKIDGLHQQVAKDLAIDKAGNLYLSVTSAKDTLVLSPQKKEIINSGFIGLIIKYDQNGDVIWTAKADDADLSEITKITFDRDDKIVITGLFSGNSLNISPLKITKKKEYQNLYSQHIFLGVLNKNGEGISCIEFGGENSEQVNDLNIDSFNNFIISGIVGNQELDFGSGIILKTLDSNYNYKNNFIAKFGAPIVPTLITPVNYSTRNSLFVNFSWKNIPEATGYLLLVSNNKLFSDTAIYEYLNKPYYNNVSALDKEIKFYWKVKSISKGDTSIWSAVWEFSTGSGLEKTVELVKPVNNSKSVGANLILEWNSLSDYNKYEIQISEYPDFTKNTSYFTANTYYGINNLKNQTRYFWKVRALNDKDTTLWSSIWNFDVNSNIVKYLADNDFLQISPNPASEFLQYKINNEELEIKSLEITNVLGESLYKSNRAEMLSKNGTIPISFLPGGSYFLNIKGNTNNYIKEFKVIK